MKIEQSNNILIAGSGVVGVELMGELAFKYPQKKLSLLSRGDRILSNLGPKAGRLLETYFRQKNVETIYNKAYDPQDSYFKQFDCVI